MISLLDLIDNNDNIYQKLILTFSSDYNITMSSGFNKSLYTTYSNNMTQLWLIELLAIKFSAILSY